VSVVPFTLQRTALRPNQRVPDMRGANIFVPVMLDGHEIKALIDTGATNTALRMDEAERLFGLSMGSADTPEKGTLNGEASLKIYSHQFKNLSFGTVNIADVRLSIIPNAMGRNVDLTPLVWDRTKTERDLVNEPELILGMDVLRRLHLYIAFQERKIYISPSSLAVPEGTIIQPYTREFLTAMIARLDTVIADSPSDANALNDRCFWRAIAKTDLDGALSDCDQSLKLAPHQATTLDSRAFVLFQQGKYPEALAGYEAALAIDSTLAPSLWMRGLVKGKLGDDEGKKADIAAATRDDPNIEAQFKRIGVSLQ
jgi:tetratricopeptide (TPR) repeat protein